MRTRQARKTRSTRGSKVDLTDLMDLKQRSCGATRLDLTKLAGAAAKLPHMGAEYMENAKHARPKGLEQTQNGRRL